MTFDEYASTDRAQYERLATIVESILVSALEHRPDIRPQQTQHRAKSPSSLKRKLERSGHLDAKDLETHAKDLAGCRLIFYTNADASKFLSSGIVQANFEIDWDRSKIHHPTSDADAASDQFISNNYVVRLKDDRANLPEYSAVAGLWCEVQVQTTLNHAWAEMAHDTIYKKPDLPGGFGTKLMQSIELRMKDIMRKHLLPAGYEFQKVSNDFDRLSAGKHLFEEGILSSIAECEDNNARCDFLDRFSSYVLPYYDDIGLACADILAGMRQIVEDARGSAAVSVRTILGSYPGHEPLDVISKAADIVDRVRYVDIDATFDLLLDAFVTATDEPERGRWKTSAEELSEHNADVWEKAGPVVQLRLLDRIKRLRRKQKDDARGLVISMLRKILEVEITGTAATFDTITFRRGTIPLNAAVIRMRRAAIRLLKFLLLTASNDAQKGETLSALHDGTRYPSGTEADETARVAVLNESKGIVGFYAAHATQMSNVLLAELEHKTLWLYRHTPEPPSGIEAVGVELAQFELRREILKFRDQINANDRYTAFKTLVGFNSVFPPSWEDDEFDISRIDEFRSERIDQYIDGLSDKNLDFWVDLVFECASIKDNDLAYFPKFGEFLQKLASRKAPLSLVIFERNESVLFNFLPALLQGWEESDEGPNAGELRRKWVDDGKYLSPIIWSFRLGGSLDVDLLEDALTKAVAAEDRPALYNMVTVAVLRNDDAKGGLVDRLLIPAIQTLSKLGEYAWPRAAWGRRASIFKTLDETQANTVLEGLVAAPRLDFDDEEILSSIAENHPKLVVDFFSARLAREREPGVRFEAIPYELSKLSEALGKSSGYVIESARKWYSREPSLFMFLGGKFVANVFEKGWPQLERELKPFVAGEQEDVNFVLQILRAFEGEEFLHPLLQDIVDRLPPDSETLSEVAVILEQSGVVTGEFGFVELHQERRDLMKKWLADSRQSVRDFAARQIRSLENRIAAEQRRAEADHELRKREWGADDSGGAAASE
jgi:ppGpp synthetase/RelA/SpoT-type nucleotidyltranferase